MIVNLLKKFFPSSVIDINFALEMPTSFDAFVKIFKVLFDLIFDLFNFPNLFTIAKEAPFFIASSA